MAGPSPRNHGDAEHRQLWGSSSTGHGDSCGGAVREIPGFLGSRDPRIARVYFNLKSYGRVRARRMSRAHALGDNRCPRTHPHQSRPDLSVLPKSRLQLSAAGTAPPRRRRPPRCCSSRRLGPLRRRRRGGRGAEHDDQASQIS